MGNQWKFVKARTVSPTLRDLAWAAGFIEGEGAFYFGDRDASGRITATQKDPECLFRLQSLFGGTVKNRCHNKTSFGDATICDWHVYGPTALGLMFTLYPWMSQKRRKQIRAVVDDVKKKAAWRSDRICHHCRVTFRPRNKKSNYCTHACYKREWHQLNKATANA